MFSAWQNNKYSEWLVNIYSIMIWNREYCYQQSLRERICQIKLNTLWKEKFFFLFQGEQGCHQKKYQNTFNYLEKYNIDSHNSSTQTPIVLLNLPQGYCKAG